MSNLSLPLADTRILVVEDQAVISMALTEELQNLGAMVSETDSLDHALLLLETFDYDLVLSNIKVNNQDARSMMRQWRDQERSLGKKPILAIALPSATEEYVEAEVLSCGFQRAITKPFSFELLTATVCKMLDRSC